VRQQGIAAVRLPLGGGANNYAYFQGVFLSLLVL
jgi:hypothetical protein